MTFRPISQTSVHVRSFSLYWGFLKLNAPLLKCAARFDWLSRVEPPHSAGCVRRALAGLSWLFCLSNWDRGWLHQGLLCQIKNQPSDLMGRRSPENLYLCAFLHQVYSWYRLCANFPLHLVRKIFMEPCSSMMKRINAATLQSAYLFIPPWYYFNITW